jgi:hypothetical protein
MLNADDPETIFALRELRTIVLNGTRPIVYWVGAGASRWLGYASWKELSLQIRREFFSHVAGFDNQRALRVINDENFPALFELCKSVDSARYHKFLVDAFPPQPTSDLYNAFINLFPQSGPLFVVTTNVDQALEASLPGVITVERADLTRCINLIHERKRFVGKLHGSISPIESAVFAESEYRTLTTDDSYLQLVKYIFTSCTVLFLAYGVQDAYVIRLLEENAAENALFGAGPHFVVSNSPVAVPSIKPIRYDIKLHPDHKGALSVLDYIQQSAPPKVTILTDEGPLDEATADATGETVPKGKTAYYISDFLPPGKWQTSQEITAIGPTGGQIEAAFGLGFTDEEVPNNISTALHDLVVGFICFDFTYLPFESLGRAHNLLGSELFWELVRTDVLRFIQKDENIGVVFPKGAVIGEVTTVTKTQLPPLGVLVRDTLRPAPGKEQEAERLFAELENHIFSFVPPAETTLRSLVRSSLLMPGISKLLGIGDAIRPTQAPKWLRFPYLRLAHLVETAVICSKCSMSAAKLPFGGPQLTAAAFGVEGGETTADQLASYAVTGVFNSDLGAILMQNMSLFRGILAFRASSEGESFRREIAQVLASEMGREFTASVNAGLKQSIPPEVLQRARDQLLWLAFGGQTMTPVRAVWFDVRRSDPSTKYWRIKGEKLLLDLCRARGIGKDDPCVCGSGDTLRVCCLRPLRS